MTTMNLSATTATADPGRLLLVADVARLMACSVRTIWRLVETNAMPQPIRLTRKYVRFREADIAAFLDSPALRMVPAPKRVRMLTPKEVTKRLCVPRELLDELVQRQELPAPARISRTIVRWSEADVNAYLTAKRERTVKV